MTEGLGRKDGGSGWRGRHRRRATVLKRDSAALMYSEGVQPLQLAQGCFAGSCPRYFTTASVQDCTRSFS